ncbi:MAG TPA: trigger factor [Dehalococcoidia bacterium]
MKVTAERIPDSQVLLEIEVDPERVERSIERASRKVANRVRIPGFRPGKAPRSVVERLMGRDALLREALDELVPDAYREALEQQDISPIDQPSIELVQLDPLVFKATVPVQPTVDLGDYRAVRVPREPVELSEELVDQTLENLRRRYATLEPVDRPVQEGDYVRADVRAEVEGETVLDQKDAEFPVREDVLVSLPGLAAGLTGAEKGAEREFSHQVPEDAEPERFRGKTIAYRVTVHDVKEERLPELNDDFARQVGEGFETLEELRARIRDDIRQAAEDEAEARYRDQVVSRLLEQARLEYPPILVEREVDRLIRDRTGQAQDLQTYLRQTRTTEEELRQQLEPEARLHVERSLVLTQVAEAEQVTVEEPEVEAELDRMAAAAGPQGEQLRQIFDTPNGREAIRRSLLTRKTLDRLAAIASADGAPAAKKSRRRAPRAQAEGGPPAEKPEEGPEAVESEKPAAANSADDEPPGAKPPAAPLADSPDDAPPGLEAKEES